MKRRFATLLFLPALLLAAGCTGSGTDDSATGDTTTKASFADCTALTRAPAPSTTGTPAAGAPKPGGTGVPALDGASTPASDATSTPASDAVGTPTDDGGFGAAGPLPDLKLPCFTGGAEVSLGSLRGPAVVNLWASWCPPCRKELPAFQRLAEHAGGRLHVVGVNTSDARDRAASLGTDFGLTFPTLFDESQTLQHKLRRAGLPITLFVDGQGRVQHLDNTGALDDAKLAELIERHLGVVVPQ